MQTFVDVPFYAKSSQRKNFIQSRECELQLYIDTHLKKTWWVISFAEPIRNLPIISLFFSPRKRIFCLRVKLENGRNLETVRNSENYFFLSFFSNDCEETEQRFPKNPPTPIWELKESHNTTSFSRYLSYLLNSRTWTIRKHSNTILYILKYVLNWYFVFRFIYFLRARKIAKNGPSRAKMDIHIRYLHDIKHLNVSLGT